MAQIEVKPIDPVSLGATLVEMMAEGHSLTEVLRTVRISKKRFYKVLDKDEELKEKYEEAKDYCEGWWEMQGRSNLLSREFNSALYFMHMRNRFGWTNNDNVYKHEHGGTVTVQVVKFCEEADSTPE